MIGQHRIGRHTIGESGASRTLRRAAAAALLATMGLMGCSGDADPLLEQVEVAELGLTGVGVVPPATALTPLSINWGEQLVLGLQGFNASGAVVDLPDRERRWFIADGSGASVDGNGVLTGGQTDGMVQVSARLGDLVAPPFAVEVRQASLSAIDSIEPFPSDGGIGATLDPCRPIVYRAIGDFQGARRHLSSVEWTPVPENVGRVLGDAEGLATVTAVSAGGAGTLELQASSAGQSSTRTLSVTDSLVGIEIEPESLSVNEGQSLSLAAQGDYGDAGGEQLITESVLWSMTAGEEFASVSNTAPTIGQIEGLDAGQATVQAKCGLKNQSKLVIVSAGTTSSGNGLAFQNDSYSVNVDQSIQLRVSTGSRYDSDDDVTEDAEWTLSDTSSQGIELSDQSDTKGRVTGRISGTTTRVIARYNNNEISVQVTVN